MADTPVSRPKRQGNYTPERIKAIEAEIAEKYAADHSAKALGREYGISKNTVLRIAERNGVPLRGKQEAGALCRTVDTTLTPEELADTRPMAQQVAERMGYASSKGLSSNREFRTACMKEARRRNPDKYRDIDNRRKLFLNRIPGWVKRSELEAIYQAAKAAKLHVDHAAPLQGDIICGLNVPRNLRLVADLFNWSKGNKFECGPDYTMPPYVSLESIAQEGGGPFEGPD